MKTIAVIGLGLALVLGISRVGTGQDKKAFVVRNATEGPRVMAEGGLLDILRRHGFAASAVEAVKLTPSEEKEYGEWNRDALESLHIGRLVFAHRLNEGLAIGLLTNCVDLLGMLAGLQHLGPPAEVGKTSEQSLQRDGLAGTKLLRVGLIYLDAHADFNTPETTLSGMLGGMDVAVAAGLCLTRLRLKTGLDPALPTRYIVFGGLRDVDPLEQDLLDRSDAEFLSVDDLRHASPKIDSQMDRLGRLTDVIYVHIDMDVLDPSEVRGHSLSVPQGPTSLELAAAVERVFRHPKAGAIGIASLPYLERDKDGVSLKAAYRLIEGALQGYKNR
ncbi:MAG: arginase family protein [Candidatus Aminicenantes bacterium]|nr:arginase family protein [Candidatus Aminicenantes bacterium]